MLALWASFGTCVTPCCPLLACSGRFPGLLMVTVAMAVQPHVLCVWIHPYLSDDGRRGPHRAAQIGAGPDAAYVGLVLDGHGLMGERCAEVCGTALLDHLKFALHRCSDDDVKVRRLALDR